MIGKWLKWGLWLIDYIFIILSVLSILRVDISPGNIVLIEENAVLIDWEFVAKIGQKDGFVGTANFASINLTNERDFLTSENLYTYSERDDFEGFFFFFLSLLV